MRRFIDQIHTQSQTEPTPAPPAANATVITGRELSGDQTHRDTTVKDHPCPASETLTTIVTEGPSNPNLSQQESLSEEEEDGGGLPQRQEREEPSTAAARPAGTTGETGASTAGQPARSGSDAGPPALQKPSIRGIFPHEPHDTRGLPSNRSLAKQEPREPAGLTLKEATGLLSYMFGQI